MWTNDPAADSPREWGRVVRLLARAMVRWRDVPEAAWITPLWLTTIVGMAGLATIVGLIVAGLFSGVNEPYPDLAAYADAWSTVLPFAPLTLGLPVAAIMLLPVTSFSVVALRARPSLRVAHVCFLPLILPSMLLSGVLWLGMASRSDFGFFPGPKPAWLASWPGRVVLWTGLLSVLAMIVAYAKLYGWAWRHVRLRLCARAQECHACGYDLSGTPGPMCPECGTVRPGMAGPRPDGAPTQATSA